MATNGKGFITKVITIVGEDKHQYFHHHKDLGDVLVNVNNDRCLQIRLELDREYVSYPLCNVERFETKAK